MNIEDMAHESWRETLDRATNQHAGDDATIEVVGTDVGDQIEAMLLPFSYVEYDNRDDVAIVAVGGRDARLRVVLRHMVNHPERVFVQWENNATAHAIGIVGADSTKTIVTFHPQNA